MKKYLKQEIIFYVCFIPIILFLFWILILLLNILIQILNPSTVVDEVRYSTIANISTTIASITSVISLVFVIGTFINDKISKRKDNIKSIKCKWYSDFICEKNMNTISEFFDTQYEIINSVKSLDNTMPNNEYNQNLKNQFLIVSDSIDNITSKFLYLIEVVESSIYNELEQLLEDFQDEFTNKLQDINSYDSELEKECSQIISKYKKKFVKILYEYNLELYK